MNIFPKMATLINKRKFAAMARETQEYPTNNQSQNSAAPGITEDYIAQDHEEIEGRVTKKLSQKFSRTESRILDALSKLDEFPLTPQIRTFSGTVPGTFRNADVENQEPSGGTPSWSGVLCLSCQQPNWLRPGRDLPHNLNSAHRAIGLMSRRPVDMSPARIGYVRFPSN